MKSEEHNHHAGEHHGGHHHVFQGIERWVNHLNNPEREKKQLPNEIIAKLPLHSNDVLVDIGAGTGYFALRIAEAHPQVKVIAADAQPEMIAYLQDQATQRQLANLEPITIDPTQPNLPVKANVALMVDTLHHIPNRVEYLKHLQENMAVGSRIAVIDYRLESIEGPPADHRIASGEVVDALKQVGYVLEQDLKFLPNQYFLIFRQNEVGAEDFEQLRQLEESMWVAEARFDVAYMERVLSPDFFEFGCSGRIYTRAEIIDTPAQPIRSTIPLRDFRVRPVSINGVANVFQVTYISEVVYDEYVQICNRSSLWVRTNEGWQLRFHQGTPLPR